MKSNIEGLPFANLSCLITYKTKLGQEKDLRDLLLIEEYLKRQS